MPSTNWSKLSHLQLGRYAEYYSKMEFASYGLQIFTSEVDDHGIDFIVKSPTQNQYYDIQVKSTRDLNYIFLAKSKFIIRENLLASVVIFTELNVPNHFLIPSFVWRETNFLFVSRDYVGKKSAPEWGINLSNKNLPALANFSFDKTIKAIFPDLCN